MMDDFENKIRRNKYEFDDQIADKTKMWQEIEFELDISKTKVTSFWKSSVLKVAASIIMILGLFSIIRFMMNSEAISYQNETLVYQELKDINGYYKGLVSLQIQLVKTNPRLSPEDKKEFLSYMDELDEEYQLLQKEMNKNLDNQYILEAIVSNYKKRIELIENLLEQINDSKNIDTNEGYIL